MSPLLTFLSSWKGRSFVESEIEQRGFFIHRHYQEEIRNYCHANGIIDDVNKYWEEVAKEWVMSAGHAFSDRREFSGDTAYRSDYLDQLSIAREPSEAQLRFSSLNPCIRRFQIEDRITKHDMFRRIGLTLHGRKQKEVIYHAIDASSWEGTRIILNKHIGKQLEGLGFSKVRTSDWAENVLREGYQRIADGLVVQCSAASGKYSTLGSSLDMKFRMFLISSPGEIFRDSDLRTVVPGFEYYSWFLSPETAVLGVKALSELFDVFSRSFA